MHGEFCWYDLMTTDAKAAESFYKTVVGWDAKDSGMPGVDYTLFMQGASSVAGLMPIPGEAGQTAKPGWTGYIAVDDVDAMAKQVADAGGTICHAPDDIPGVGRFAVVADPQGAMFSLFKPNESYQNAPVGQMELGGVGWRELYADDWEKAFAFYAPLFGWTKAETVDMGAMGVYQLFGKQGAPALGGMMTKPASVPAPFWQFYFNVEATDAAAARVKEAGGDVLNGPMEVPGGAFVVNCRDPQGAVFSLVAMKR